MGAWANAVLTVVVLLFAGVPAGADHPFPRESPPIRFGLDSTGPSWFVIDFLPNGQDLVLDVRTANPELVALRLDVYRADGTLLNGYETRIDTRGADLALGGARLWYDVSSVGFEFSLPLGGGGGDGFSGGSWSSHDLGSECRETVEAVLWSSGGSETLRVGPTWENARLQIRLDASCLGTSQLRAIAYVASTGFESTAASIRSADGLEIEHHATGRGVYLFPVATSDDVGLMVSAFGLGAQVSQNQSVTLENAPVLIGAFGRLGTRLAHTPGQPSQLSFSNAVSNGSCPCAWPVTTDAAPWTFSHRGTEVNFGSGAYLSLAYIDPAALT